MKITGASALLQSLLHEGVDIIFGYPGGAIMPTYDALYDVQAQLRHILARHEQGAVHAAEGYARMTGKVGVCLATSGPGATNLITGITDAMLDSVPIVCITGQVSSALLGTDAFQEADIISISLPVTKWNYQITCADEVAGIVAKAFYIARSGRPGPVLIDITKDAQFAQTDFSYHPYTPKKLPVYSKPLPPEKIQQAVTLINNAKKPYILAGHGVLISNAQKELMQFAEKANIPVACTLLGLAAFPTDHPLYVGYLGMHGNYGPNLLTNEADVIIAVGMRFDDRVTGKLDSYAKQAKIIHIDIDPAEIGKNVPVDVALLADAKVALQALHAAVNSDRAQHLHDAWIAKFKACQKIEHDKVIASEVHGKKDSIKMAEVVYSVAEKTKGTAVIVTDVGQHQMVTARYSEFKNGGLQITSGGLGTMGFALPAAIGAKLGDMQKQVIAIIGDGGFQMNIQELGVLMQENLPVKVIILNNGHLGMVRQWQELFFESRYSFVALKNPDFIKIAEGYSVPAKRVTHRSELDAALDELLKADTPYVLEVVVENQENIFPMIASGTGVGDIRLS